MLNQVQLIGRLGKDPEIRRTAAGDPVATMRIATSERWKDKATGEQKEKTEWHSIVVFNETTVSRFIEPHVHKGDLVFVQGKLQTRKWQDQSGQDRYSTEVVLTGFSGEFKLVDKNEGRPAPSQDDYGTTKSRDGVGQGPSSDEYRRAREGSTQGGMSDPRPRDEAGVIDDDIPF